MTLVRQLFAADRDPTRPLNEIVNVEDDLDVRTEIDEYVFTDHTRAYLRTLVDGILDTAQGQIPDVLRGWIAGFFGSGKSHFLKLSGALLENRPIDHEGSEVPALQYLARRHKLDLPWQRLAEFRVKAVTINLALAVGGSIAAQRSPLLYRLASQINRAWDHSAVPHVADLEREIQRAKKWQAFVDLVRERNDREGDKDDEGVPLEWTDGRIRDMAAEAHRVLEDVLPKVLPKYSKGVRDYLRDKENEQPSPESVVQLASDFARFLHADLGRVLLCVDEVALYLKGSSTTFDANRVRETVGLAEHVKDRGKGRVFLFVTAQLRVDTIDGRFSDLKDSALFLQDRFPSGGRLELEDRDIDTVVRERWLKKDEGSPHWTTLRGLVHDHGGTLANVGKLREVSILRDTVLLTDEAGLLAYYPFLPYHVRLLQEILSALRRDEQTGQTAAQSRALLTAVREVFLEQNGGRLANEPLGTLVTFDRVYDVIRGVVRRADNDTDRWITEAIDPLPASGSVSAGAAARVIFLLQQLNPQGRPRIRVSAENVATLLYPRLGAAWEPHLHDVRAAIDELKRRNFIDEEVDAGFRFYRADEKTFREKLREFTPREPQIHELLRGVAAEAAKDLGMAAFESQSGARLDVAIHAHTHATTVDALPMPKGLELQLVWRGSAVGDTQIRAWAMRFADSPARIVWALPLTGEIEDLAREVLELRAAIEDHDKKHGHQAIELLRRERKKLSDLSEITLPEAVKRAIGEATVIHAGSSSPLTGSGRKVGDVFKGIVAQAVTQVFTQLPDGDVAVEDPRKVLTWKTSQPLPEAFRKLQLLEAASGRVLHDRPFLKELQLFLRGRRENERTGKAILEQLRAIPYGWPEGAIKAGLAALLRSRRILVRPAGEQAIVAADERAEHWLGTVQKFNKSVVEATEIHLSPADVAILGDLFAKALDETGLDTLEKLESQAEGVLRRAQADAREAKAALEGYRLPGAAAVGELVTLLDASLGAGSTAGKLRKLLDSAVLLGADPVAAVSERARVLRAAGTLRVAGKLSRLAEARLRVNNVYPALGEEEHVEQAALVELMRRDELMLDADRVLEREARFFAVYARAYRSRHAELQRAARQARERLEGLSGWAALPVERRRIVLAPIEERTCGAEGDLILSGAPEGRCPACKRDLWDMVTSMELIESRTELTAREIDRSHQGADQPAALQRRSPRPPPHGRELCVVELSSSEQMQSAIDQIEAELRKVVIPARIRVLLDPQ